MNSSELSVLLCTFSTRRRVKGNEFYAICWNSNLGHEYVTELSDDDKWNLIEYYEVVVT